MNRCKMRYMYLWAANCVVKGAKSLEFLHFHPARKKQSQKPEILKHGGNGGKTGGHGGFFGVGSVCPAFMCELRSYSSGLSRLSIPRHNPKKPLLPPVFPPFPPCFRISGFDFVFFSRDEIRRKELQGTEVSICFRNKRGSLMLRALRPLRWMPWIAAPGI